MKLGPANRSRLPATLALALLVASLGLALRNTSWQPGESYLRGSYDSLHSWAGTDLAATADSPVVIVYLDLHSYAERSLDPAKPWPRELHAALLRRLKTAGAKAAVFDIVFSSAGPDAAADQAFAEAIHDHGNVILAAEYNDKASVVTDNEHVGGKIRSMGSVYPAFADAAAGVGFASLGIDDDQAVRRFIAGFTYYGEEPALAWAAARVLQLPVTQPTNAMARANQFWIRYYGPATTIPHVGYSQALTTNGVRDDFFRGKIVFIGARPSVGIIKDRQDEFRSPFHSWKYKERFMPGVEIHATQMLNLVRGDNLERLAAGWETLILLLVALLFGGGLIWLRPVPATFAALAGAGVTLGLASAGFAQGVWFPWLIVAGAQIPFALGGSVLFRSLEWYHARKRFEAAKRLADAKIREQAALIDKAHDAILVEDLDGKITYANPSAERLYGWRLEELQRHAHAAELFSPNAEAARSAHAAVIREGEWNGELHQQTKSGQALIVTSRWTLIRDEAGQPKALLLINSDITEQKNLEQQFLRTQRMNTIGTLAGGMAHDLNNALAPILMGTQLLRRKATDPESRELLGMMETSTHRGADMVRQVLLFARGRGGDFERLELGTLVKELEKLVRETFPKNIAVAAFLPGDLWSVRGNPTQLHQVLLNLCVNARDAMPDGGKLSLVADNVELGQDEAALIPEGRAGEFVSLLVSDTGTGMPPEVRAKIFDPFFSTKGEGRGTGIGLSTVLRLVKSHDGFLRVESQPGSGTSFEVFLPRVFAAEAREAQTSTAAELPRGSNELILVAEDEKAIRELVTSELRAFGYRVLAAANGAEAITLFHQHADEVRLLITDNAMPVVDGSRAITELRCHNPRLPVILTSGETEGDQPADVRKVGKPFALEELLAAIQGSLKSD